MTDQPACRIRLHPGHDGDAGLEPVTIGVALLKGWCHDARALQLTTADGVVVPLQARVLEAWSDRSIRWVLLDFQAAAGAALDLTSTSHAAPSSIETPVVVRSSDGAVSVDTGAATFDFATRGPSPLVAVTIGGERLVDRAHLAFVVTGGDGQLWPVTVDALDVEDAGPLRAAIVARGRVQADVALGLTLRAELFAGSPAVRMRATLHNPRAAVHEGGFWELGDPGSVRLGRVAFEIAARETSCTEGAVRASIERHAPLETLTPPLRIHQESSGRPQWQSAVHVNADGRVPLRYAGYRVESGAGRRDGAEAHPLVVVGDGARSIAATSRLFWEVFPKAYAASADGALAIELLPDVGDLHELQGGECFTHEYALAFGDAGGRALTAFRLPSTAIVDPAWWAASGDVSYLEPVAGPGAGYEDLVRAALDGDDTFQHKRDRIDEYGWRHYGDLYADHENGPASDRPPIVSHYNNQYDAVFGSIAQFMRSGDPRWWAIAHDLAVHVAHVDIYWTDADKSAYNGGLFWHTAHYADAGRSSHRTYPRSPGIFGGGPSVEQNYSTGLLLHHLLTGSPASREAVLRLARWTAEMDDGSRTVFRFLSRGPTGLASATGSPDYHGPGRGPAHAIHTFLNAFRLTRDRAWLARAEQLIARCVHPDDDLAARNLLDAERRWYYTVFLQALGRYLGLKGELGEHDGAWHYARASLLHYAQWMVTHEYPYLDKPEILEYPTETWAAQDMRKCEVFNLAAAYTPDAGDRTRFVERARFFFDSSVTTLQRWPTRTWTRPVVLMLAYGFAHLWFEARRDTLPMLPASPAQRYGAPAAFEPQKTIAIRRAKIVIALGALATLGALAAAIGRVL